MGLSFSCTRLSTIPVISLKFFYRIPVFFIRFFTSHFTLPPLIRSIIFIPCDFFFPSYSTHFVSYSLHCIPGIFHNILVFLPPILALTIVAISVQSFFSPEMFQSFFSHSFPFCIYSGRHVFESVFMEFSTQVHYPSVIRLPHTLSFSSHALAKFCCSSYMRFCHYVKLK